jgi:hypothetical protein
VIAAQPFPMSYMYRKRIQEEVVLKLLTGAHANFLIGEAQANIIADTAVAESRPRAARAATARSTRARWRLTATGTPRLSRCRSSRARASCRFGCSSPPPSRTRCGRATRRRAAPPSCTRRLRSAASLSEPFVVMTHENQWVETVGALLRETLFGANGQGTVTWQRFCNVFQHHVLRTTRQDTDHPRRPLSLAELSHFHALHFGKKASIDSKSLDKFWQWFGPALNRMHFKRHLASLWADGIIGGFMSRADAEAALQTAPVGAFLIRFSDTRAGQLVISYVPAPNSAPEPIVHFLVPPHHTDERSFPDSLRDWEQFSIVLKTPTHGAGVPMLRERTFEPVPKSNLLAPYYSKKKVVSGADIGYQDNPL